MIIILLLKWVLWYFGDLPCDGPERNAFFFVLRFSSKASKGVFVTKSRSRFVLVVGRTSCVRGNASSCTYDSDGRHTSEWFAAKSRRNDDLSMALERENNDKLLLGIFNIIISKDKNVVKKKIITTVVTRYLHVTVTCVLITPRRKHRRGVTVVNDIQDESTNAQCCVVTAVGGPRLYPTWHGRRTRRSATLMQ